MRTSTAGGSLAAGSLIVRSPDDERGRVWGTGRYPTLSKRRGHAGKTWFPPRPRTKGERCSRATLERPRVVDAARRVRNGLQTLRRDRLAAGHAQTVRAGLDPPERRLDF